MDKDIREVNAAVLLHCVNACFELGLRDAIDQIMSVIFSFFPEELVKNWLKIHQVLWFLCELTRSGSE